MKSKKSGKEIVGYVIRPEGGWPATPKGEPRTDWARYALWRPDQHNEARKWARRLHCRVVAIVKTEKRDRPWCCGGIQECDDDCPKIAPRLAQALAEGEAKGRAHAIDERFQLKERVAELEHAVTIALRYLTSEEGKETGLVLLRAAIRAHGPLPEKKARHVVEVRNSGADRLVTVDGILIIGTRDVRHAGEVADRLRAALAKGQSASPAKAPVVEVWQVPNGAWVVAVNGRPVQWHKREVDANSAATLLRQALKEGV